MNAPKKSAPAATTIIAGVIALVLAALCFFAAVRFFSFAGDAQSEATVADIAESISELEAAQQESLAERDLNAEDIAGFLRIGALVGAAVQAIIGLTLAFNGFRVLARTGKGRGGLRTLGLLGIVGSLPGLSILGGGGVLVGVLGCIALVVATSMRGSKTDATEHSRATRKVAAQNAARADSANNLTWVIGPDGKPLEAGWMGDNKKSDRGARLAEANGLGTDADAAETPVAAEEPLAEPEPAPVAEPRPMKGSSSKVEHNDGSGPRRSSLLSGKRPKLKTKSTSTSTDKAGVPAPAAVAPDPVSEPEPVLSATPEPQTVPETLPETVPDAVADTVPETMPENLPEAVPENLPENLPETMPDLNPPIDKEILPQGGYFV